MTTVMVEGGPRNGGCLFIHVIQFQSENLTLLNRRNRGDVAQSTKNKRDFAKDVEKSTTEALVNICELSAP